MNRAPVTIFTNVNIFGFPNADSIACSAGRILQIGAKSDLPKASKTISLNNNFLYPGFNDTHLHIQGLGEYLSFVKLHGVLSVDAVLDKLREHITATKNISWVRGMGWDQNLWPKATFPTKESLDTVSKDTPICLSRIDGHAFWVNSKALEIAGITKNSPDPQGGRIIKDPITNEPTGILIDKAMDHIWNVIPEHNDKQVKNLVDIAFRHLNSYGITSIGDAGTSPTVFNELLKMESSESLPIRVNAMIPWKEHSSKYHIHKNDFLISNTFKVYLDGALGSRGAALLEPYSDDLNNYGLLLENEEDLVGFTKEANSIGYQVAIHAIGDHANRLSLNVFEKVVNSHTTKIRNRIEHAQIISPDDIKRFKQLNILPSVQPIHCTSDMDWVERRLGERTQNAYPWNSLIKSGSPILSGSDAPIESCDPLKGLYAASTRNRPGLNKELSFYPNQSMSLDDGFKSYTSWAAMATYEESKKGLLQNDYLADMVVLSDPIDFKNPESLLSTSAIQTIVNGEIVYEAS